MSPTCRLPVLHVFTPLRYPSAVKFMNQFNERNFGGLLDVFLEKFREPSHTIILAYDITLTFLMEKICKALSLRYTSLIVTQLCVDMGVDKRYEKCGPFCRRRKGKRHTSCCLGRSFCLPATYHDKSPRLIPPLVFFGPETSALENLTLSLKGHECYRCNVEEDGGFTLDLRETTERNKFLRRRLFLIEKVREANVIGVVVGTLAMEGYLDSAKQIMSLIRSSGRKCYLIAVGRPTPPKLANFLEIDVFVVIACPESARQLDLRGEYHKPIVTPYEVAAALATPSGDPDGENARRWEKWGGLDYIPDFRELLPGLLNPDIIKLWSYQKLYMQQNIDVFVVIACPESARQLDLRGEYHKPIVTPYEVAAALATPSGDPDGENARRWEKWGGLDYIPDFRELLPGGSEPINSVEENNFVNTFETDVSLLSGRIRSFGVDQTVNIDPEDSSDVAVRDSMPLSVIHQGGGGEFLAGRSWKGLEVNVSEKTPSGIVPGRVGTASGYQTEEASLGLEED
ncbi:hypothetical protein J437_LFUL015678 [Ladona fulva]|uniref:2-(3-amino-3-carboxypropyl)histidine synthase subunit 2 n=1 Tax=Ladona fulva TaxID=123851 RepID=A0A8K0KHJ2_LADFU|nr:hypothetical protein J437_LFUL015678 [Ladona fulva]